MSEEKFTPVKLGWSSSRLDTPEAAETIVLIKNGGGFPEITGSVYTLSSCQSLVSIYLTTDFI